MNDNFVFSYAENAEGRMVHVDSVPNGLKCKCNCPHCHEQLLARHGDERTHHFAHHSENRGANLNICYMVILYKLAEQIVQTKKRIHAPSYYGIYIEKDLEFIDVKINSDYEREDKQPDVIATTKDGKQYLIEFTFEYKVQHKKPIDYKSLSCLEIDLSQQSLESLEDFLLSSAESRKWLNNDSYFTRIEETYLKRKFKVKVVTNNECQQCKIKNACVNIKDTSYPMIIENNGENYRICKTEIFEKEMTEREMRKKHMEEKKEKTLKVESIITEQKNEDSEIDTEEIMRKNHEWFQNLLRQHNEKIQKNN